MHMYLYHKNHIKKVMDVAFMAYAFDLNVENGSDGAKIGCFHIQGACIAKRDVRQSHKTNNGKTHYDGPIVCNKGDAYLIDCNVTGLDEGTSDKPNFSLLALFRENVFPTVDKLVAPGGKYEGYEPIFDTIPTRNG